MKHRRAPGSAFAAILAAMPLAGAPLAQSQEDDRSAVATGPEERLAALRGERDALLAVGEFAAALEPATLVVTSQEPDLVSHEDHARLARIQAELGQFDDAERNYLRAIELVERREGELSITLVDVYRGLGRTSSRNRQFPEAITALEAAQHITQRHLGLFN